MLSPAALTEQFLLHLAAERGRSVSYRLSVRQSLGAFSRWMEESGLMLPDITAERLVEYQRHLHEKGLADSSCRIAMVHLRIFFRYLASRKLLPSDPAALLKTGKPLRKLPETLSEQAVKTLLESISPQELPFGSRDRALLELLYSSGLRVSELVNLRAEQVDWDEGFLRIRGKGDKTRYVPLGKVAEEALRHYLLHARPLLLKERRRCDELFVSRLGSRLTRERIRQIIRRRAAEAGLPEHVYPHLMRHSFASHLLGNGADLRVIQDMLGHADLATTQIYTHVEQKRLVQLHHRFHPRGSRRPPDSGRE